MTNPVGWFDRFCARHAREFGSPMSLGMFQELLVRSVDAAYGEDLYGRNPRATLDLQDRPARQLSLF
jgi:hypothetical protein